jgi:hypothetical protein
MDKQGGQDELPDPILGTVLAKAVGATGPESEKAAAGLFMRVLGPSADEIGEALRRYTAYRLRNVGRIVETADDKAGNAEDDAIVNPRVARVLLEEGSYCDDPLMTNYLGGVLAASRTQDGRDDRAVTWSRLLADLSALQIRAHYLLYREWADRLHGIYINLGLGENCQKATMHVESDEFETVLAAGSGVDGYTAMTHALYGLAGAGLIQDDFSSGTSRKSGLFKRGSAYIKSKFEQVLDVRPSPSGLELYGWAQGLPGLAPNEFPIKAVPFDLDDPI